MDNLSQNFEGEGGGMQQHPPQKQFLLYVDGELPAKEAAKWNAHLDACWSCRVHVGKIQETIADIIEFEEMVSPFQTPPDSHCRGNFDSRLGKLAQEIRPQSRFRSYWKQLENFRTFNWSSKSAVSSLAVLPVFAIFYQFVFIQGVSASELLDHYPSISN